MILNMHIRTTPIFTVNDPLSFPHQHKILKCQNQNEQNAMKLSKYIYNATIINPSKFFSSTF